MLSAWTEWFTSMLAELRSDLKSFLTAEAKEVKDESDIRLERLEDTVRRAYPNTG